MQIWEGTSLTNRENSYPGGLKEKKKDDIKASYTVILIKGGLKYFLKWGMIEYK